MPTTDIPDIEDVGVEEITMNSTVSFDRQNVNYLNKQNVAENCDISNQIAYSHNNSGDVEATLKEGI